MDKCKCQANGNLWTNVDVGEMVIMDECKCRANGNYGQMQMSGKWLLWTNANVGQMAVMDKRQKTLMSESVNVMKI